MRIFDEISKNRGMEWQIRSNPQLQENELAPQVSELGLSLHNVLTNSWSLHRLGQPKDLSEKVKAKARAIYRNAAARLNEPGQKERMIGAAAAHMGITFMQLAVKRAVARPKSTP